jgi:hypothetical protein
LIPFYTLLISQTMFMGCSRACAIVPPLFATQIEVHAQRLYLEKLGHPGYCYGAVERFDEGFDAARLAARHSALKEEAVKWASEVEVALLQTRRLKLLDGPVLLRFIQSFRAPTPELIFPFVFLW